MEDAPQPDPLEAELIAMINGWNNGERSDVAEPIRTSSTLYDVAAETPMLSRPQPVARPVRAMRVQRPAPPRKSISLGYCRFLLASILALGIWALAGNSLGPHHRLPDMVGAIATFWVTATALKLADLLAERRRSFGMCLILRLVGITTAMLCVTLLLEAVYNP